MSNPLSPSSLAQVPEVSVAFDTVHHHAACFHEVSDTKREDVPEWTEKLRVADDTLVAAIRDAVLSAERSRLLALTSERVDLVEAFRGEVARLVVKGGPIGPSTHGPDLGLKRIVDTAVAALPLLLAPEVAKREAVEFSAKGWEAMWEDANQKLLAKGWEAMWEDANQKLLAAEAERDRLRDIATKYDKLRYRLYNQNWSSQTVLEEVEAALGGSDA